MDTDKLTPEEISALHARLRRDSAALDKIMFPDTPKWTQDEAIAFECACDAIRHMMSICSGALCDEKRKSKPDALRIAEIEKRMDELWRERTSFHVKDHEKIATIRREYGAQIRAHNNLKLNSDRT